MWRSSFHLHLTTWFPNFHLGMSCLCVCWNSVLSGSLSAAFLLFSLKRSLWIKWKMSSGCISFEDSICSKLTDEAWWDIGLLKSGSKEVFSNLSAVMLGILVVLHRDYYCERVFSLVTINKTQYRASLGTDMISALMTRKVSTASKGTVCHMEAFGDALLIKAASYEAKQSRASATASRGDEWCKMASQL